MEKLVNESIEKTNNTKWVDRSIVILFFVGIFLFLTLTGTLNSGYHFIDDHGILNIKSTLDKESFVRTNINFIKSDLNIRFRPLYYPYYISGVKMFGVNFLNLSIFVGLMSSLSFSFFYLGMRKLGHSFLKSVIFVLLIFIGSQLSIWWRLGTNETIGVFFLGLSFLFMAKCLEKSRYKLNNILFLVFLVMASLCKESFLIIIPAFIFFKIWNEKRVFQITSKESIKKNILSIIPIIIMFAELWIIKFVVGTNRIGYAGMTSSANEFYAGVKNIIWGESSLLNWMGLLGALVLIYLASFLFNKKTRKQEFVISVKYLALYSFFSLMVVLPSIFMYAKSGMVERYLLPTTLGLSFLAIGFWQNTKGIIFRGLAVLAILIFVVVSFNTSKTNAVAFSTEGRNANEVLSAIKNNSKYDSKILLVTDPVAGYEISYSTRNYLSFYGLNNVFGYPMMREYNSDFKIGLRDQWMKWFENRYLKDMNGQPDAIFFIDKIQSDLFFSQSNIPQSGFHNILDINNPYAVYIKNNPS